MKYSVFNTLITFSNKEIWKCFPACLRSGIKSLQGNNSGI